MNITIEDHSEEVLAAKDAAVMRALFSPHTRG